MGSITVFIGPMFGGKTQQLLIHAERAHIAGKRVVLIKWRGDTRYEVDGVRSHSGLQRVAEWNVDRLDEITDTAALQAADVVAVDEGQFFTDLVPFCERWANAGKRVLVSALSGDFRREAFPVVAGLLPRADHIHHCTAVCRRCGSDYAAFTRRRTEETTVISVGGSESYEAICRACLFPMAP